MKRVKSIIFYLPKTGVAEKNNNDYLFQLFFQLKNFERASKGAVRSKPENKALYPKTIIAKSPTNSPRVSFFTPDGNKKMWKIGNMELGFNLTKSGEKQLRRIPERSGVRQDNVGEYLEIYTNSKRQYVLTLGQLFKRLDGRLLELNHSGVNFGPKILSKSDYLEIKNKLAETCNLYRYPTGEEWLFIIPSTKKEFLGDIKNESISRNPKFELVYSRCHPEPLIQFDIETNLAKNQLLRLLPQPYGISFPGLENFFRTVFVFVDWAGVILRFDLRFKSTGKDFGYWLINQGGRIKPKGGEKINV